VPQLLSPAEKRAGRAFLANRQADLDARNAADPPGGSASVYWRVPHHECTAAGGASKGITLRENYEPSPEYRVCYCGAVAPKGPDFPHHDCDGSKVVAADGQFAFIWKEGRCSGCGLTVRTTAGRFVIAADRPPENGRTGVERQGQAGAPAGDPRQPRA
jgi:hypothetical protein